LVDEAELVFVAGKVWRKRFVEGRISMGEEPRSGRPLTNDVV
jgi:hypothetical protein